MPKNYNLYLRGEVGGYNFDSGYVSYILDSNKDKEVNVLIDSRGGRVDTALSISSLFQIHGNVHAHFVGMNASAATIAAMGAKHVSIDSACPFLVHKCLNLVLEWDWMNADQLEDHIAKLQKMKEDQDVLDSCIAGIYARRCKKTKDELLALMKKGGWISAKDALEWGFVDEVTDYEEDEKPVLTEAVASAMCSAGIPLPPIPVDKKDSFFDRLRKFFSTESGEKQKDLSDHTDISASHNPINNSNPMKKFPLLAALLGVAIAAEGDTPFSPKAEDLQKIEDSLAAKDKEISDLKASAESDKSKIGELEKTVADLKKAPADSSQDVTDNPVNDKSDGPGDDIDAIVAELANAFKS
ncbi:MAG: Clp protease ClpP [Muribaculaceae bacterium]|nr:Clp protease ClpP [Muribaculaceae bacterium]